MENTMKMYITADEVAELLGVSRGYAYKVIRGLNDELKAKGFRVISGKVPRKYFQEKYYGKSSCHLWIVSLKQEWHSCSYIGLV